MSNIIRESKNLLIAEGIFLIIIGLIMIYLSQTTTILFALLLSIGLFFIGIYRTINAIIIRNEISSPILTILSGVLLSLIGLYLIMHPVFNILVITVATAIYFLIESINSFSAAISSNGFKEIFWFGLLTGIIQLILAIFILLGLPYTALWVIGLMLGINFIFAGITNLSVYSYLNKTKPISNP